MKVNSFEDMQAVWRKAGRNGGRARDRNLSKRRKREIARKGGLAKARNAKQAA